MRVEEREGKTSVFEAGLQLEWVCDVYGKVGLNLSPGPSKCIWQTLEYCVYGGAISSSGFYLLSYGSRQIFHYRQRGFHTLDKKLIF